MEAIKYLVDETKTITYDDDMNLSYTKGNTVFYSMINKEHGVECSWLPDSNTEYTKYWHNLYVKNATRSIQELIENKLRPQKVGKK